MFVMFVISVEKRIHTIKKLLQNPKSKEDFTIDQVKCHQYVTLPKRKSSKTVPRNLHNSLNK